MRRIFIAILVFVASKSHGQLLSCNTNEYAGIAPFTIDGSISDWETILGASTSDPVFPFNGSSFIYDTYGENDPDGPEPKTDIRVKTVAYDQYNAYFYFRRLDNANSSAKAFYFLDTNVDGLINSGEPVIMINFNGQNVHKLSLGRYVATNPNGDPIGEPNLLEVCKIDGFPIIGTVNEVLNSNKADLLANEIFAAAVTEDGYGVELAVPFRLISEYKYFSYHLSLQKGGGNYQPDAPSDNAGGCGSLLNVVGEPDIEVTDVKVSTITQGLSYQVDITFKNLTPAELQVSTSSIISFKDIVQNDNLPIDERQFGVTIGNQSYRYFSGSFLNQPIQYSNIANPNAGIFTLAPLSTATISIIISFPPNGSVQSATIEITPSARFKLETLCFLNTGGGGKPINPVGFTVGEEPAPATRSESKSKEEGTETLQRKILVYPNPSTGDVNVILPPTEVFDLALTDYGGKVIRKWDGIRQNIFRLENLKTGFYLLNIKSKNSKISVTKKIIVN